MDNTELKSQDVSSDMRSSEAGTVAEHRTAHEWLRANRFSEREILLQVHSVLVDVLEALQKGKK